MVLITWFAALNQRKASFFHTHHVADGEGWRVVAYYKKSSALRKKYAGYSPKSLEKPKRRANNAYPLRDGCEKTKIVPVGRGKPRIERYRETQLAACEQVSPTRTIAILGFFAHITWQASGLHESEALANKQAVSSKLTPVTSYNDSHKTVT